MQNKPEHVKKMMGWALLMSTLVLYLYAWMYHADHVFNIHPQLGLLRYQETGLNPFFLLGTDPYGRSILILLMLGAGVTMLTALLTVGFGGFVGITLGALCFIHPWFDRFIQALSKILFVVPSILTISLLTAILNPGLINVIIAVGLSMIPVFTRLSRNLGRSLWAEEFVLASIVLGRTRLGVYIRHVIPNMMGQLRAHISLQCCLAVLAEAAFSYLGFGLQPPYASLGRMLYEGQTYIYVQPMMMIAPGIVIMMLALGFYWISESYRN